MNANNYNTKRWEEAKPSNAIYTKFEYDDTRQVVKVWGKIKYVRMVRTDEGKVRQEAYRCVRWDARGRCSRGTHNVRYRDYDIRLAEV